MRKWVFCGVILFAVGALAGFFAGLNWKMTPKRPKPSPLARTLPDYWVRGIANSLEATDVRAMRFKGMQIGEKDSAITVSDPVLIQKFLDGLKTAEMSALPASGNQPDEFTIHLKRKVRNLAPTIELRFSPRTVLGSFSPAFHAAVNELRPLQAKRIGLLVQKVENELKRIEIGDRIIADLTEMRRVTGALRRVDERAFAFTDSNPFLFPIVLYASRGRSFLVMLNVKQPPKGDLSLQERPLPAPLWDYYGELGKRP